MTVLIHSTLFLLCRARQSTLSGAIDKALVAVITSMHFGELKIECNTVKKRSELRSCSYIRPREKAVRVTWLILFRVSVPKSAHAVTRECCLL